MKRFLLASALSALTIAAHAAVKVDQAYDSYAKSMSLTTSQLKVEDATHGWLDPSFGKAWLSASVGKTGAIAYALNVYYYSGNGWAFFSSARDSDGGDFAFTSINRQLVVGDSISEQFLIVITPDYLAAHQATGLDVKFYGKGREMVVNMPAEYLQAIAAAGAAAVTQTTASTSTSASPALAAASAP